MQTLIYARFSSQLQDSRSIDDQVRICRERAEAEGWQVAGILTDYAISGSVRDRPGLNALLQRVAAGGIDIVLSESIDRISRSQIDQPQIFASLQHMGTRFITLAEGEVNELHIGFKGTMAALFRKDLAQKIRRGKKGRVAAGRIPGGLAYGYRMVRTLRPDGEFERGLREVDPDQAEVVRRIFREYLAGRSPRVIAARLNSDGVPGPTGGPWRLTSINGDRIRKNGILQNELYIGRLYYNRTSRHYHPETRKRIIRVNPMSEWQLVEVPALRIIDDATWEAVTDRRARFDGTIFRQQKRPKRLLSGLATCGVCGGSYIVVGVDRWGCTANRDGRTCDNGRTISNGQLEQRVLDGLQRRLLHPDVMAAYVREYHEDRQRRTAETTKARATLERQLSQANNRLSRMVAAIGAGGDEFAEIREAMRKARDERDKAAAALAEVEALPVIALHPAILDSYREQVATLTEALNGDDDAQLDASNAIRALIDRVVLTPAVDKRGVDVEVIGRLAAVLGLSGGAQERRSA